MRYLGFVALIAGFTAVACSNDESSNGTTPTPATIFSQGSLSIAEASTADLDRGTVGIGDGDDIWFERETDTNRFITPLDGVTAIIVGTTAPGRAGCATQTLLDDRIDIDALTLGTYLCVRTNQGRVSQVRVTGLPGPSPGTLVVEFTTYS